jgi:hypothetical protein
LPGGGTAYASSAPANPPPASVPAESAPVNTPPASIPAASAPAESVPATSVAADNVPAAAVTADSSDSKPEKTETAPNAEKAPAWRSQWLYLRASINYPVTFYSVKPDGLYDGNAIYRGPNKDNPDMDPYPPMTIVDKFTALPEVTLGLEFQFLPWLSFETNLQTTMGYPVKTTSLTMAAGAELKFPFKISNFALEPYGAFLYPFIFPSAFKEPPGYAIGGGIQAGAKAGSKGVIFFDLKYMYYMNDAVLKNQNKILPKPEEIHYRHFTVVLGFGYKHGFVDRK